MLLGKRTAMRHGGDLYTNVEARTSLESRSACFELFDSGAELGGFRCVDAELLVD